MIGPLLIYGGSIAVEAFSTKPARAANLNPIIAIAGNGLEFVYSLLASTAGDGELNYRNRLEQLQRDITIALTALDAKSVHVALDAVPEHGSWDACAPVLGAESCWLEPI